MDTVEFRHVAWNDPIIKQISYDCGSDSVKHAYNYIRAIAFRNERCVCEVLGEVGYYFGYFGKKHFRLVEVAIKEEEQHKGYGSRIMRRIVRTCRAGNIDRITLRCSVAEGNWRFYLLQGFTIVGKKQDDFEMELKLEEYLG